MICKESPELDGIPVEFYQEYCEEIKHLYMAFINKVKERAISKTENISVIKIIYIKNGGIMSPITDQYR